MADTHGRESKIPPAAAAAEKLAPIFEGLEAAQHDGPAWEKKTFSRPSTERVGVELEHQDRVSNVSAIGLLTLPSRSNSEPDLLVLDKDDQQQPPANDAGSSVPTAGNGLTHESSSPSKRGGVSGAHSIGQSAHDAVRSPTAEGSDAVALPPPRNDVPPTKCRNPVEQNNATSFLADSSRSLDGDPRQRGDDARRPGPSTERRRSDSPESPTSALLLLEEGQVNGAYGSAEFTKSCTTQLDDSSQQAGGARHTSTSVANAPSAAEQASKGENMGDFHALLREAMQQSDAELAAEKESACTFKRQLSLPALAEHSPPNQCGDPGEPTLQPVTNTSNIAEGCCRKYSGSGGSGCVSSASYVDETSLSSALPAPLPETTQGQWVRYVSPEGHPYLYNDVTGGSRWVDPSEEEVHPAADTGRSAASKVAETERTGYHGTDRGTDGTDSVEVNREGREQLAEEGGSVATFDASQTSQDISDPDARNSAGETAMHLAAAQHSVRGLHLLLAGGANVNAIDERGRTPLHVACDNSHRSTNDRGSDQSQECIELLLSRGALEDARDAKGQTPLHISALAGNLGAAQALIVAGATASADAAGNSPLHLAAAQNHSEIMQLLVLGVRACNTQTSSSDSPEEVSLASKLTPEVGPGSCAATELATEGTDASGSVSEARYPPMDKPPPLADGRHPLDRAVADSSSGDEPCGGTRGAAFQTSDTHIYHGNASAGISRRKQERGLSGAQRRAQSQTRTGFEDPPTSFGTANPIKMKRPTKLSVNSSTAGEPKAEAEGMLGDGSSSCRDDGYLAGGTEIKREEMGTEEYRRDSYDSRRERGARGETKHAPAVGVSARGKDNRRSRDGGFRNQSPRHRRHDHDQLGRELDPAEVGQTGLDTFETREWQSKNVGDTVRYTGEGDEDGGRQPCLDYDHARQRREGKGGKAGRGSRRRQENDRDDEMVPWPEALSPDRYEQVMGAVLAAKSEGCGAPPYSALAEALLAACVASRLDDAAAVLLLLEEHGRGAPSIVFEGGLTPLHHACRGDDVPLVRLLCRARADPEARDFQGNSPLTVAAATGSTSCLRFLLQGGVDPNTCNDLGDAPLHVAAWLGNLSCVKALVGGGARLSQRNKSGLTAREGLLNAGPNLSRGRRPKVLRATLKYLECAEESATQPKLPAWTSQEGYDSDFTAVTAASRTSPERSNDIDVYGSKADISRRQRAYNNEEARGQEVYNNEAVSGQGVYNSEEMRGASLARLGGTRTPAAPGDREREGGRNWERWKPQEERGFCERRREGDTNFSRAQRRDSNTEEYFARSGNFSGAEQTQIQDPYGGGYSTKSALTSDGSLAPHFEPSRERYNADCSVAEGAFSGKQAVSQVDYGVDEYDTRRRHERNTAREETLGYSPDSHGSRHRRVEQQEVTPDASTPSRAGGGVWSAVGRAFDYMIGSGDSRHDQDGFISNAENDDRTRPPSDRPPADSELRERIAGTAPSSLPKPMLRDVSGAGSAGATLDGPQHVDAPLATKAHGTKVPISLTPMQPPPDVLAAMKGRVAAGQRQQFSAPPADVATAIDNASEKRQRDYGRDREEAGAIAGHRGGVHGEV